MTQGRPRDPGPPAGPSPPEGDGGDGADVPAALRRFLELHEQGEYWESHEVLEGPWRKDGSPFYQGLILYASAWVHWRRANAHGVDAQLRKALERLEGYPDGYLGLDVEAIRSHCREARDAVARDPDGWAERIAPLELRLDHGRIRGDEAELGV